MLRACQKARLGPQTPCLLGESKAITMTLSDVPCGQQYGLIGQVSPAMALPGLSLISVLSLLRKE